MQLCYFRRRKRPDNKLREVGFGQASEVIAGDPTLMLETLAGPDRNLGREAAAVGEYGSANDRGVRRVDQFLLAHHNEAAVTLRISLWFVHTIEISTPHGHFAGECYSSGKSPIGA